MLPEGSKPGDRPSEEAITAAPNRDGITASPPPTSLPSRVPGGDIRQEGVPLRERFEVLGIGLALGAVFALFVAGPMMPSGTRAAERVFVWALVMGGPIAGTVWGLMVLHPILGATISLGWLGLLLVPTHPCFPSAPLTGFVTLLGLSLWFVPGYLAVVCFVWGA